MRCHHCKEPIDIPFAVASHGRAYCSQDCENQVKDGPMLLYFMNECKTLRLSALEYFSLAYQAVFKKPHPNPGYDVTQYNLHSQLPNYVVAFIREKQRVTARPPEPKADHLYQGNNHA
jgi:hypothetical protein